jgi:hypothetical protein
MINVNTKLAIIVIEGFMYNNSPRNPNMVKKWIKILDMTPDCFEKDLAVRSALEWILNGSSQRFKKSIDPDTIVDLAERSKSTSLQNDVSTMRDEILDMIRK